MNDCQSIREDLDAYQDGMMEASYRHRIESHLEGCGECRRFLRRSALIGQALREMAQDQWKAPGHLWERIMQSYALEQGVRQESVTPRQKPWRWAMAAMLVMTIGLTTFLLTPREETLGERPVASALVNEFHTFVISRRDLDYSHGEPEAIREWFSNKVNFRVPLPRQSSGMQLAGGRLCNLLDQRVVSFMYLREDAWVSLYIMKPVVKGSERAADFEQLVQGYGYIKWFHEGLQYSLVGDIPIELLRRFADQLSAEQYVEVSGRLPQMTNITMIETLRKVGHEQV